MKRTLSVSLVLLAILCNVTITTSAAVKHDRQNTEVQPMPPETYIAMQRLADYGLVKLPAGCRNVREANFDRHEMAVLALQAIKRIGMDENGLVDGNRNYRLTGYRETLVVKDILNQE
ncbi:MAG: hypothetical protein J6E49_02420, partial [Acidaminococcaceae bacterium]|nr:hypothetical protein [Acidaminococcaceae bacterium]